MPPVNTVLGPVDSTDLGVVLPHEHVFLDAYEITLNSNMILSDDAVATAELRQLKKVGGDTIVDQTVYGLNPQPQALRQVSEASGVQIIAGTGFYWERFHPPWLAEMSETEVIALLVRDLTTGFAGTDIQAGILGEIATHHNEISPAEARVLRACAQAQREVGGVPISTHALFTRIGLDQVRLLENAGADLDKVVIGHVDTTPDIAYHETLLQTGVWIAYDSIGQRDKQTDERRADAICELVARGHADRLLLSADVGKRSALAAYGGRGYEIVITEFLPLLRERGMDDQTIAKLTRDNPHQLFS